MIQLQEQTWARKNLYLLTTEGGSIQLDIYTRPQGEYGIAAYIHNLWVQPHCRREGKAKKLLDKAETIAHNKGISAVHLEWEEVDTPKWMLDHYISRGYEEVEFCDGYALLKKPLNK